MKSDAIEMEEVVAIGVVVSQNIGETETAADEKASHVGVLWRVGSVELVRVIIEPGFKSKLGGSFQGLRTRRMVGWGRTIEESSELDRSVIAASERDGGVRLRAAE